MTHLRFSLARAAAVSVFAFTTITVSGCGGERPPTAVATSASLQRLAMYMGKYVSTNRGTLPKNEADLKAFMASQIPPEPEIDKLFVSERDGKPFIVSYANTKSMVFFAYEQVGADGARYVAMPTTEVKLIQEAEFQSELKK